jgi:hypothetical protein
MTESPYFAIARELISAERERQIRDECWTLKHDDEHSDGEMLSAAVLYMNWGTDCAPLLRADGSPLGWPWDAQWWKPKDRKRNLERAGALMLAEKERLGRVIWNKHVGFKKIASQPHPVRVTIAVRGMPTDHVDHKLAICVRELAALLEVGR